MPADAFAQRWGPLAVAHEKVEVQALSSAASQQEQRGERLLKGVMGARQPRLQRLRPCPQHGGGLPSVESLPDAQVQQLILVGLHLARRLPGQASQLRQLGPNSWIGQARWVRRGEGLISFQDRTPATAQPFVSIVMRVCEEL